MKSLPWRQNWRNPSAEPGARRAMGAMGAMGIFLEMGILWHIFNPVAYPSLGDCFILFDPNHTNHYTNLGLEFPNEVRDICTAVLQMELEVRDWTFAMVSCRRVTTDPQQICSRLHIYTNCWVRNPPTDPKVG